MKKRIVIVGGVAAGASAAAKARRTTENVEIVLVEAGPYISFANCGLPYYLGGEIAQRENLFVVSAKMFARRFDIDLRVNTRVIRIDRDEQTATLALPGGDTEELSYDRLILATGTLATEPPIEGIHRENIFTVRTVPDVDAITDYLAGLAFGQSDAAPGDRALVIGAGYIGLETAEQFLRRGMQVTVVELARQVMLSLDPEMAQPIQQSLEDAGATVHLGDAVAEIFVREGETVARTTSGREIPFDIGIVAAGVKPNVELAKSAGLNLGKTGAIAVDDLQRTSDPSIYAAGDNSETMHAVLNKPVNIPLAGPANKAGRAAGANAALDLLGHEDQSPARLHLKGVLGTAGVRVGEMMAAATGLSEKAAREENLDAAVLYIPGQSHAGYYPGAEPLLLKLVYETPSGRILGAQAVGGEGADKRIDVIATAIQGGMTVEDLEHLDLSYAPPFGSAKDLEIQAGFAASNDLRGVMPLISPQALLERIEREEGTVLDVRTMKEYEAGHLDEAIHIPVDELRQRADEVPSDGPLYVHCAGGYRSYVAQRMLMNRGRSDVYNVTGGWNMMQRLRSLRDSKPQ